MSDTTSEWVFDEIGDPDEFFIGLVKERLPNKADAFQEIVGQKSISFTTNENEERCFFTVNYDTSEITVGVRAAARLMAHSFAYSCAHYGLLLKIQSLIKEQSTPDAYETCILNASYILQWAVAGDVESKGALPDRVGLPVCPPADLLTAFQNSMPSDKQDVAGVIYANAIVWFLLHEVSHLELGHDDCKGFESIEQEKEADRRAAAWMLDDEGIDQIDLQRRKLGVATALGWLVAPRVYLGTKPSNTHPAAYNRLCHVLDGALPSDDDCWLFVQVVLMLHVINHELAYDDNRFVPDFRANVDYLIDIIASVEA